MGKDILTYSPVYLAETIPEFCDISTHLDFNLPHTVGNIQKSCDCSLVELAKV